MKQLFDKKLFKVILISIVLIVLLISIIIGLIRNNKKEEVIINNTKNDIRILVTGEVNNPGYYYVPLNSKISDAVSIAGGYTDNAIVNNNDFNIISDGDVININSKDESINSSLVNINYAYLSELMTLPGIGEAKANAIIEFRITNGPFTKIEDIMKVSGISQNVFNKIKDYITV